MKEARVKTFQPPATSWALPPDKGFEIQLIQPTHSSPAKGRQIRRFRGTVAQVRVDQFQHFTSASHRIGSHGQAGSFMDLTKLSALEVWSAFQG